MKDIQAWDLFSKESLSQESLEDWGQWFHQKTEDESPKILVGYSFGGRLALHALIQNPEAWCGAVLISTNPGLTSVFEKQMRLEQDRNWAKKFLTDPWELLMNDWNNQSVFQSSFVSRREQDYERGDLHRALTQWSLGHQENLRSVISQIPIPILWVNGELDTKFRKLSESLTLSHPKSRFCIAPQVGHRIISAKQEFFVKALTEFKEALC
ncbi:MAG: 2-succinyl-6-hydroxy-2,4-cyclohexadiene-1-carboxylate synthase [Chlamydiae bacterium]|nr:2-succinyl-6-hydroxy-2,4-cyclohexadiene-1-carboxylate synthase [Chlamydiota bacterium]